MSISSFNAIQISGVTADKFKTLVEQLGHLGLTVASAGDGYKVSGPDIAGSLAHNSSTNTLTAELHQFPGIVTPGHLVGRLYDAIISLP
jgi:hypothetical protein